MMELDDIKPIKVTLLANSGFFVEYNGLKILVDGTPVEIHGNFNGLSEEVLTDLLEGEKPLFRDIDLLLYTHFHRDHFSPETTGALVAGHKIRYLIMPDRGSKYIEQISESVVQNEVRLFLLDIPLGEEVTYELDDIKVGSFRTMHAGEMYRDTDHYCYLLNLGGKVLLVTGDSDFNPDYFKSILTGIKVHAVIINPLFLNRREGRTALTESINPDKIVVCHIPFEGTPGTNLRKIAARDSVKHRDNLPEIILLQDELQEIVL